MWLGCMIERWQPLPKDLANLNFNPTSFNRGEVYDAGINDSHHFGPQGQQQGVREYERNTVDD